MKPHELDWADIDAAVRDRLALSAWSVEAGQQGLLGVARASLWRSYRAELLSVRKKYSSPKSVVFPSPPDAEQSP